MEGGGSLTAPFVRHLLPGVHGKIGSRSREAQAQAQAGATAPAPSADARSGARRLPWQRLRK